MSKIKLNVNELEIVLYDQNERINNETLTINIQNRRDCSNSKGCSPLQLLYNLIVNASAIAYFAYTNRYRAFG